MAKSKGGIFLSQGKYVLYLLQETGMLGCKPAVFPIDPNHRLKEDSDKHLINAEKYQRVVGCLIYLSLTRSDIAYAVGVVGRFMHAPTIGMLLIKLSGI